MTESLAAMATQALLEEYAQGGPEAMTELLEALDGAQLHLLTQTAIDSRLTRASSQRLSGPICRIPGCNAPLSQLAKHRTGLCQAHYATQRKRTA